MPDEEMTPVVDEIISEGKRIRILVVGKTGVGKTSLIKKTFNVETLESSHDRAGKSDIEQEITSKENDRFVIHDSEGYEPGDSSKLERLQEFIEKRSRSEVKLSDRVHAIWLCIGTPHAGGRVLEKGTEILLESIPKDIAMVVVFTKYDRLVVSRKRELRKINPNINIESVRKEAEDVFKASCVELVENFVSSRTGCPIRPLIKVSTKEGYANTVSELVRITEEQIALKQSLTGAQEPTEGEEYAHVEDVASLLGIAQMVDVEQKIGLVIRLGKKKYWRGLAASTHFPGLGLQACLSVLHYDIVKPWNINDPEEFLLSKDFESWITRLVEGLEKSRSLSVAGKYMSKSIGLAGSFAGVTGAAAGPAAPIVAPTVFVGVFLAHWVYETYKSTPDTVRCLMSYIVHLFHIMQDIFRRSLSGPGYTVSKERIEEICKKYQESALCKELSKQIDQFITNTKTLQYGNRDYILEKLEELCRYSPHELRRDASST